MCYATHGRFVTDTVKGLMRWRLEQSKRADFVELRQKGSHVSLERRAGDQVFKTVVPMHSDLAKGTLSDILKQCGLKLDEFLNLL